MIDIYAAIAVGSALVIGTIPILFKRFREKDFLVTHVFHKKEFEEYLMQLKKDGDWIE